MSIQPANYDFIIRRGNYGALGAITIALFDTSGGPVNFDHAVVTLAVNRNTRLFTKTTSDGSLIVDRTASTVSWHPTDEETRSIPKGRYATYALTIAYDDGSGMSVLEGYMVGAGN
jgi:sucrose-6-phosphate hydrolase SacC (GH32 family)